MEEHLKMHCKPITPQTKGLEPDQVDELLPRFSGWRIVTIDGEPRLRRDFEFGDFAEGVRFAGELANKADEQGCHPLIVLDYGEVRVDWWTSDLQALHENDFVMAAKTDDVYSRWELIDGQKDAVDEALDETFPASDPASY